MVLFPFAATVDLGEVVVNLVHFFKIVAGGLSLPGDMLLKKTVEKIDAQRDHLELDRFKPGTRVTFQGKPYLVQRRTTLASGEAAVVLEGETEQFVIATERFLAGVSS
jgi:hypothetical protein